MPRHQLRDRVNVGSTSRCCCGRHNLRWKGLEKSERGDRYTRSGPGTVKLSAGDAQQYIRTRFPEIQNDAVAEERERSGRVR